jgi:hypothetical protein
MTDTGPMPDTTAAECCPAMANALELRMVVQIQHGEYMINLGQYGLTWIDFCPWCGAAKGKRSARLT